jgi:3-hydroxyisobutyrate dehydrogenase
MTAVSILGLGAMGSRIAARIADAGHDVTVWNRSPDAAHQLAASTPVHIAPTARHAVATAEVAISMVTDDDASRSLWLDPDGGILAAMPTGSIAIEASTITPSLAVELATAATTARVGFLEAPVVGSRPQAEAGALFVLVGGDESVLDGARPVIDTYAGAIKAVGAPGQAATMKLAINGLFGIQVAAYAEIFGLLTGTGMEPEAVAAMLSNLPITSPGLQRILGLFASRDFAPNFPVALVAKDFRYLQELATSAGAEAPITGAAATVYTSASDEVAGLDIAGIATNYL